MVPINPWLREEEEKITDKFIYFINILVVVFIFKMLQILQDLNMLSGYLVFQAELQIKSLWNLFTKVDAIQVEINPLVETEEGDVVAVDAKIQFDDNAKFRQLKIFEWDETSESDPREVEAAKHNLNYIGLNGNIGCLGV